MPESDFAENGVYVFHRRLEEVLVELQEEYGRNPPAQDPAWIAQALNKFSDIGDLLTVQGRNQWLHSFDFAEAKDNHLALFGRYDRGVLGAFVFVPDTFRIMLEDNPEESYVAVVAAPLRELYYDDLFGRRAQDTKPAVQRIISLDKSKLAKDNRMASYGTMHVFSFEGCVQPFLIYARGAHYANPGARKKLINNLAFPHELKYAATGPVRKRVRID